MIVGVDHGVELIAFACARVGAVGGALPAGDVEAVLVEAADVGHAGGFEPSVGFDGGGKVNWVERVGCVGGAEGFWGLGGEERRIDVVAGEVEVHGNGGGDEELVRDGVLVGFEVRVPDHAAGAEGGIPTMRCDFVEDARAMCRCGGELCAVP